jgi:hypothetical protein
MLTQELLTTSTLNNELREFAEEMPVIVYRLSSEEAVAAVEPYFPELVNNSTYLWEFLDPCGIVVIVQLNPEIRISWSVAITTEEAQSQLMRYSEPIYSEIRKSLNINYHWVIKVRPDFWGYDDDELIARSGSFFMMEPRPECWIIELG